LNAVKLQRYKTLAKEEQLSLAEKLVGMESNFGSEYILKWWQEERQTNLYTILIVYRGNWCAFCRGWMKRWNKVC
jgi:hypothetical protein